MKEIAEIRGLMRAKVDIDRYEVDPETRDKVAGQMKELAQNMRIDQEAMDRRERAVTERRNRDSYKSFQSNRTAEEITKEVERLKGQRRKT